MKTCNYLEIFEHEWQPYFSTCAAGINENTAVLQLPLLPVAV
jgi:hypothetical protein